jgi:hypothetical protein
MSADTPDPTNDAATNDPFGLRVEVSTSPMGRHQTFRVRCVKHRWSILFGVVSVLSTACVAYLGTKYHHE